MTLCEVEVPYSPDQTDKPRLRGMGAGLQGLTQILFLWQFKQQLRAKTSIQSRMHYCVCLCNIMQVFNSCIAKICSAHLLFPPLSFPPPQCYWLVLQSSVPPFHRLFLPAPHAKWEHCYGQFVPFRVPVGSVPALTARRRRPHCLRGLDIEVQRRLGEEEGKGETGGGGDVTREAVE